MSCKHTCQPAQQPPSVLDSCHPADCGCLAEPREIIDLITPFYQACGGRLYRLLLATKAAAVFMGDGNTLEFRMAAIERALALNTSMRFADNIAGRDALAGLTPGDCCLVFDATADPTVHEGAATYIWLPSLRWKKIYNMDTPIDPSNFIQWGGGLAIDGDRLVYVDASALLRENGGLAAGEDRRIYVVPGQFIAPGGGLATDEAGRLIVSVADIIQAGGGLGIDGNGHLYVSTGQIITPGGGLATDGEGHIRVDMGSLVNPGTGLVIGEDGKLRFDVNSMPSDYFDSLLRALRLPKWLTGNMDFYVNGASGDDSIVDGRGTQAMPFRTIQACVNHACDNYNVSDFQLTIHVAAGTYNEAVRLKDYSRMDGQIVIDGAGKAASIISLSGNGASAAVYAGRAKWKLANIGIKRLDAGAGGVIRGLAADDGANVTLENVAFTATQTGSSAFALIGAFNAQVNVGNGCAFQGSGSSLLCLAASSGGIINLTQTGANVSINGSYGIVAYADNRSLVARDSSNMGTISGTATGRRYAATSGSGINSQGAGANYFPGSEAGTTDALTYSWYN